MDALIILALAVVVVIGAFYFLGIGKPKTTRRAKTGNAYSKRAHHKK